MNPSYLLIGSGRVSSHFGRYLRLLGFPVQSWSRKESKDMLAKKADASSHILCLISDPAIEPFLREHRPLFGDRTVVHASGSIRTPLAEGAHPLMTFAGSPEHPVAYDLETYRSIPFVLEKGRKSFEEILPGLPNPHYAIEAELKPLYHALCVLSGNFTVILWQKAFAEFEAKLGLPREVLLPYLARVATNLAQEPTAALTGPLARGDQQTIQKHLEQLDGDPFASVYRAFVSAVAAAKTPPVAPGPDSATHGADGLGSRTGGWK